MIAIFPRFYFLKSNPLSKTVGESHKKERKKGREGGERDIYDDIFTTSAFFFLLPLPFIVRAGFLLLYFEHTYAWLTADLHIRKAAKIENHS